MKITTPKLLVWAVFLTLIFLLINNFVDSRILISVLNGIFFGISAAVLIVYSPLIHYTITNNVFDRISQLCIGIGLVWLSMVAQRGWSMYNRFFGNINATANSPFTGFIVFVAILGGVLFVSAPGYNNSLPRFAGKNREMLTWFAVIGGLITGVMYYYMQTSF